MHTRVLAVVWGLVHGLVALIAAPRAAEGAEAVRLSLSEALSRAVAAAPEVVNAQQDVRQAEARRVGAGIVLPVNPRLSLDYRPPITGGNYRDAGYGALIDVLFEPGGAPGARVAEANREAGVARADLQLRRWDARIRAFTAYVRTQVAELRISENRSAIEVSSRVLAAADRRVATGAGSELEKSSAELDVALLQAAEASAIRERDAQLMILRDALDFAPDAPLELTSTLADPPRLEPSAHYLTAALRRHPELAALEARSDLLAAVETRLAREAVPKVGLYGGVDAAPLSPIYGIIGVSVELPVAQRNQGPRAVAMRAREAVRVRLELDARRLARAVVAAHDAYEARRSELERLSGSAIPAAARTLAFAEAGWQAGRFDVFRLLTATRDALRLRANRIDVLEAAWIARIDLERAVGGEVAT